MKIVVVHSRYRSATPSGENRVVDQELAALAELGHDVQLFQRRSDDIAGWSAARKAALPAAVVWNGQVRRELRALLRATRPDVVHIHNTFPLLSASVLYACRDAAVPVVVTLHNYLLACASGGFFRDGKLCHECIDGPPTGAMRHGCYRGSRAATAPVALAAMAHRRAWQTMVSAYTCVSASQRELLRSVLPNDRVFIRHNMIPELSVRETVRRADVVYAGRLEVAKGTPVLMAGWDRYLAQRANPELRLVIAGSGALEDSVRSWAASRPSVELVGQLEPDACAELMAGARAVVLPSICEETFGLALIEAMAQGVAPMAAARGAFRELITDGVNGLLFQPDDPAALAAALALAEAKDKTFEEYGAQARKTYEQRFNPADSMQELLGIYRFAVANPAL
jgi:glycosyltransferase involved in cell wall biosynthesis